MGSAQGIAKHNAKIFVWLNVLLLST